MTGLALYHKTTQTDEKKISGIPSSKIILWILTQLIIFLGNASKQPNIKRRHSRTILPLIYSMVHSNTAWCSQLRYGMAEFSPIARTYVVHKEMFVKDEIPHIVHIDLLVKGESLEFL